ncbi:putative ORFan [Tupanvirus deep ocean]|uniref:ORFan n=2 Tax=Tupanvirus TaxID=2094720 RepID=A0AC62A9Z4_9VIRU|nr:putative ORFan [Tupanvirus deep ocean]QKU34468.1 putative ORFan [Tupanvirus deep ocean]
MPRNKSKKFGSKPKKLQPNRRASNEIINISLRSLSSFSEEKQAERMREIATGAKLERLFCALLIDISKFLSPGSINRLMRTCRSFYFLMTSDLVLKNHVNYVNRIQKWLDAKPVENYGIHTICKGIVIAFDKRKKWLAEEIDDDYYSDDDRDYPWDYSGDRYYSSQYRYL